MPLCSPLCSVLTMICDRVSGARPVDSTLAGLLGASTSAVCTRSSIAVVIRLLTHRAEHLHEPDRGGPDGHDPDGRENTDDEREHHLDAGLGGGFFGALTALGPQRLREDAQRVGDAGAE